MSTHDVSGHQASHAGAANALKMALLCSSRSHRSACLTFITLLFLLASLSSARLARLARLCLARTARLCSSHSHCSTLLISLTPLGSACLARLCSSHMHHSALLVSLALLGSARLARTTWLCLFRSHQTPMLWVFESYEGPHPHCGTHKCPLTTLTTPDTYAVGPRAIQGTTPSPWSPKAPTNPINTTRQLHYKS